MVGRALLILRRHRSYGGRDEGPVEKLGELMAQNPLGLTAFRDELTGLLKTLDKQGHEAARGFLLEALNGTGSYTFDRIGRGTVHIPATCLALFGTIQPGPLARHLRSTISGDEADGLIQRLQMMVYPDVIAEYAYVDRWPDGEAKNRAYAVFHAISTLDPSRLAGCGDFAGNGGCDHDKGLWYLGFDDGAQCFFVAWFTQLETRLRFDRPEPRHARHLSRFRSLLPSLALIFHLIDSVDDGGEIARLQPVSLAAARMAARWCEYLERHAERVYQRACDGDHDDAAALAEKIKESLPNPCTVRDIQRKGWAGLDNVEGVRRVLGILEDRGWLKVVEATPGLLGGRPTEKVWLNPAVLKAAAPEPIGERATAAAKASAPADPPSAAADVDYF